MRENRETGFTLLELMVVIVLMGILATFSIPALASYNRSARLKGASHALAAELRLARERALSTHSRVVFHVSVDSAGADYHLHDAATGSILGRWSLPREIGVLPADSVLGTVFLPNGRADRSFDLVLTAPGGLRDTLALQVSGLTIAH